MYNVVSGEGELLNTHITGVVDEPGCVAVHGGIDHHVIVNAEHVAADALGLIILLSHVTHAGADHLWDDRVGLMSISVP